MIRNEDTYCIVQHKIVRELGAWEAVVYSTIATLLRKSDGIGEVSNQTLMDMCGIKRASLFRYIGSLIESGYIEKRSGNGRSNISIYYITKKGLNLIPLKVEKGSQNDTERVSKKSIKGLNLSTINKGEIKEKKESGSVMRETHTTPLSDTTPQIFEKKGENIMEDFKEFWSLFPESEKWNHEKEACERVWHTLQQSWRDNLVQQLRDGKMWRKRENENPYWYLKNYNGETSPVELPFLRQGTAQFGKWLDAQEKAGRDIAIMRYEGKLAYCRAVDVEIMEAAGAEFLSIMRRRTSE